jgi:hypothetical protein
MPQHLNRSTLLVLAFVTAGFWGCGQSGSDPPQYPEVRFEVRPTGQATFRVDSLIGGGVSHSSVIGQEFAATAAFDFILENAAPPYQGSFTLTSGDQITVTLTVISTTGQTQVSDATVPGKTTVNVLTGGPLPSATPGPSSPEVRFDVCAPLPGGSACSTTTDPGTFGVLFTGSLGDDFMSHVLNGATPAIYFLEAPRNTANGVFMRQPFTGDFLVGALFINGVLQQTQANSQSIVISQDL